MVEGMPKITKNLISISEKVPTNWERIYKRMDVIFEQLRFETHQKILEEIFKFTDYEINLSNYMGMLLSRTLLIEEVAETNGKRLHVYFRGEHLMNIRVTSEVLCPRGASRDKVGYQYVTKISVDK